MYIEISIVAMLNIDTCLVQMRQHNDSCCDLLNTLENFELPPNWLKSCTYIFTSENISWANLFNPGIRFFSCSTQLSIKFIMLINVKMSTIVGIFTFISMINTTTEKVKARKIFIFQKFRFYEQMKCHAQLSYP